VGARWTRNATIETSVGNAGGATLRLPSATTATPRSKKYVKPREQHESEPMPTDARFHRDPPSAVGIRDNRLEHHHDFEWARHVPAKKSSAMLPPSICLPTSRRTGMGDVTRDPQTAKSTRRHPGAATHITNLLTRGARLRAPNPDLRLDGHSVARSRKPASPDEALRRPNRPIDVGVGRDAPQHVNAHLTACRSSGH
jgi:hypothetical protein